MRIDACARQIVPAARSINYAARHINSHARVIDNCARLIDNRKRLIDDCKKHIDSAAMSANDRTKQVAPAAMSTECFAKHLNSDAKPIDRECKINCVKS